MLELDNRAVGPEPLPNLLPCDHLTLAFDEHGENFNRLITQPDPDTAVAQLPRLEIQFKPAEFDDRGHFSDRLTA